MAFNPSFRFRSVPLLLLALSFLPAAALAQAPAPAPASPKDETFSETFDVTVVNVEVFVTDREGKRVTGLTQDDFQVLEDGKPVSITNFYAADGSVVSPGAAGGSQASPSPEVPEDQRLHLGVLVDTTNLAQKPRERLEKELTAFLSTRLAPDDRVLLASYGMKGFKALPFRAGDAEGLKKAVADAFNGAPVLSQRLMQLRSLQAQVNRSATPGGRLDQAEWELDGARLDDAVASYGKQVVEVTRGSVTALEQFLAGMTGLPGRKVLLYVSGGLPVQPLAGILEHYKGHFGPDAGPLEINLEPLLRKVEERANANRITFYALGESETVLTKVAFSRMDDRDRANMARGLDVMSLPTGGLTDLNAKDPAASLARMREDFDSYYSLGYTPPKRQPGESHSIDVKVNRPGLTVRHRQSYRQRTGGETLADQTVSALFFGARENPLAVAVRLAEGAKEKDQQNVTLELVLPLAKIVLVPNGDSQDGKLQIAVAVRDVEGRSSNVTVLELPVRIASAKLQEMQGKTVGYKTKLALRPLEQVVAVGVRDTVANLASVVTTTWKPGMPAPAR